MARIDDVLVRYGLQPSPPEGSTDNPFRLVSTLEGPAAPDEIEEAWSGRGLAAEATGLWTVCRRARLFEDVDYGQWGLAILSPTDSAHRTDLEMATRSDDFKPGDVVIGEFLGDQELLVLAPSEIGTRRVLVALPLDGRDEWLGVGASLGEFLSEYFDRNGDKYWEPQGPLG